jgi:glycosyltransferase involved in cell wall biosynthesis
METHSEIATSPDVVFGVPLYNHAHRLRESIESLLSQKCRSFAIVLVDDQSSDNTNRIAMEYAERCPNVHYHRNDKRLGLARNWRKAFLLAREKYPGLKYFAWGSDHDVWHPRWLPAMIRALENDPQAVLAYPLNVRLTDEGNEFGVRPRRFDTRGVAGQGSRLLRSIWRMRAGDMVYGLFRADALERGGVFRGVLLPDRLLLAELSLVGEFVQVPQLLWYRRYRLKVSVGRQRKSIFPDRGPAYSFLPWWLVHGLAMAWSWGIVGVGRPIGVGRLRGLLYSALLLCSYAFKEVVFRPLRRVWRRYLRRSSAVRRAKGRLGNAARRSGLRPSDL